MDFSCFSSFIHIYLFAFKIFRFSIHFVFVAAAVAAPLLASLLPCLLLLVFENKSKFYKFRA